MNPWDHIPSVAVVMKGHKLGGSAVAVILQGYGSAPYQSLSVDLVVIEYWHKHAGVKVGEDRNW